MAGGLRDMSKRKMIHFQLVSRKVADGYRSDGLRTNCEVMVYVDYQKAIRDGMRFFITTNGSIVSSGFEGNIPYNYVEYIVPAMKHSESEASKAIDPSEIWNASHREGIKIDERHWRAAVSYIGKIGEEVVPLQLDGKLTSVSRNGETYNVVM
jgi:hypothetical protein